MPNSPRRESVHCSRRRRGWQDPIRGLDWDTGRRGLPRCIKSSGSHAIRAALEGAGFSDTAVHLQDGALASPSLDRLIADSAPMFRFAPGFAALADDERDRVLAGYRERIEPFTAADGSVRLPMPAFVAVAVRP